MDKDYLSIQKNVFTSDFQIFCRKNFLNQMKELEKVRKFYILGSISCVLAGILIFAITVSINIIWKKFPTNLSAFMSFIALFSIFLSCSVISSYKTRAKKIILDKLLSYIGNFYTVEEKSTVLTYVKGLKLFDYFNRYGFDDRIKGVYNNLQFDICEMNLVHERGSGKNKTRITVFSGVLITVNCNKTFNGYTVIKRNNSNLFFKKYKNLEKVNLEDVEFEKLYDVFSNDQIEARYLLTTSFMNRMVNLEKKGTVKNITMSFENGKVNIAVSSSKNWFEIPVMKSALRIENYRAIILEMLTVIKIINSLKLNQDIGI